MEHVEVTKLLSSLRADVAGHARAYVSTQKAIDGVLKALKDPSKNAVALAEAFEALQKTGEAVLPAEAYKSLVQELRGIANKAMEDATFVLARDLRAAFEGDGVHLTGAGERFISEPLVIEVDKQRGKVNIKFGRETLNAKPLPADPARIVAAFNSTLKALTGRKLNPNDLLRQLFEAYRRVISSAGTQLGERAGIVDCYRELVWIKQSDTFRRSPTKASFSDYPRAFFGYDMLQLRRQNTLKYKNYRLQLGTATIDATDNAARAMWMPEGAEDGRYMMDIFWTKES